MFAGLMRNEWSNQVPLEHKLQKILKVWRSRQLAPVCTRSTFLRPVIDGLGFAWQLISL